MQGFENLLLLSGPSGGGKSTFVHLLKEGALPDDVEARLPPLVREWPVVDVTNHMRRQIETEGEMAAADAFGAPADLILHYDITTVYRYGLAGYESDPALRLLRLARNMQVVFVCPDSGRLYAQFVDRDAARKARKSRFARGWNAIVLGPVRKLHMRLTGQVLYHERELYRDPHWIGRCYSAWEAYVAALKSVGAAQDLMRVAPCENGGDTRTFHIVPEPERPLADSGDGTRG